MEINGRTSPMVASTSKWLEKAKELIQNLYFKISVKNEDKIKQILQITEKDKDFLKENETNIRRKYKIKLFSLLHKLSSEIGIYEKVGDEYRLNIYLAAYLLGIDKLPDGSPVNRTNYS